MRVFDASRSRILHVGVGENQSVALLGDVRLHDETSGEATLRGAERRRRDLVKAIRQAAAQAVNGSSDI